MHLVCATALLLDGDFTLGRQNKLTKSRKVPKCVCVFFKMKKHLQASSKSSENCFKITLWTSSGFSEVHVFVVTARENTCNCLFIVEALQQTWSQSSTLTSS